MKAWIKISFTWLFLGGKSHIQHELACSWTENDAMFIKNWLYMNKVRHSPNHWAAKQMMVMCEKRINDLK